MMHNTSIEETLSRFNKDARELYITSPIFNACVMTLAHGGDIYHLLKEVVILNDKNSNIYKRFMEDSVKPSYLIPSDVLAKDFVDSLMKSDKETKEKVREELKEEMLEAIRNTSDERIYLKDKNGLTILEHDSAWGTYLSIEDVTKIISEL